MLVITNRIQEKLATKHAISNGDSLVRQAFHNMSGATLIDTREKNLVRGYHTEWFVANVDGKRYKVVFIRLDVDIVLKTVYLANDIEISLFDRLSAKMNQDDQANYKFRLLNRLES